MNKLKSIVLCVALGLSFGGHKSQAQQSYKKFRSELNDKYRGTDVVKELFKSKKDTVFTRYFNLGLEVDSTRSWRERIVYEGKVKDQNQYELTSSVYRRDFNAQEEHLYEQSVFVYIDRKAKYSTGQIERRLSSGLIERLELNQHNQARRQCLDENGKQLNTKGCLLYSYTPYPYDNITDLTKVIKNNISSIITKNQRSIPDFVMVKAEANYTNKSWVLAFEFPKGYDVDQQMYQDIVTRMMQIFNEQKLEDYHFNKDILGNYYNYYLNIPLVFHN